MHKQIKHAATFDEPSQDAVERVRAWAFRLILETVKTARICSIQAALGTDGRISSECPATSEPIELRFALGQPESSPTVLFIAEQLPGGSLVADWCPKNNFFRSAETAALWVAQQELTGKVVDLDQATQLTVERWKSCIQLSQSSIT